MSMIAKRISAIKDFAAAKKAAESIVSNASISAEDKAAVEAALAEHKGNPDRVSAVQTEGTVVEDGSPTGDKPAKVGRVWEEKIGGVSKEEIKAQLEKGEIDFDKALELSSNNDGFTIFCSAKSGTICLNFGGRNPTSIWEENLMCLLNNAEKAKALLVANHKATRAANEAAKAAK